jgi:DNA-binding winged helix-turn-helix (wHTH) protein
LRDEMIAAVWPATVVGDNNLNMQIAALRRVLDEGRADGSCIETVPRRGCRFTAGVMRTSWEPEPPLPDKPSIAVLPFQNLSGDPQQEYFADGVVEEIITALSRITWLSVIARN